MPSGEPFALKIPCLKPLKTNQNLEVPLFPGFVVVFPPPPSLSLFSAAFKTERRSLYLALTIRSPGAFFALCFTSVIDQ